MEVSPNNSTVNNPAPHYDVVLVGAGLSGIGSAYWLQQKCPQKKFLILEGRETLGGTWDLFRYPGVRSDSDMFTFGFRFKPWINPQPLSTGDAILSYLQEIVDENGIDQHIRFGHRVQRASWSGSEACWTLTVHTKEGISYLKANFLYLCSGYYSYEQAHRPQYAGEEDFKGRIVQPQFWPQDLSYKGKKVVVIGSGATAVTLVPTMAAKAAHVTMLQRSPTYVMRLPNRDMLYKKLAGILPGRTAYRLTRAKNLLLGMVFFRLSRWFPGVVKKLIIRGAARQLPPGYDVEKHFTPRYNPWDQRLCVIPDGDLFRVIREGKASVVTDEIDQFTESGIRLTSGAHLEADLIVLATGLTVRLLGGIKLSVDGSEMKTPEAMVYKGMMVSDVPNLALSFGYTNASWTLKTDLTANYVCKLLNYMDKKGFAVAVPRRQAGVRPEPFLDFSAGYIQRAHAVLPKQGSRRPWRVYQNYLMDMLTTRFGRINDGVLQFRKKPPVS